MQHFPIFVAMQDARVLLSGGGDAALAKLRLLLKTPARIEVFSRTPDEEIRTWHRQGRLHLIARDLHDLSHLLGGLRPDSRDFH